MDSSAKRDIIMCQGHILIKKSEINPICGQNIFLLRTYTTISERIEIINCGRRIERVLRPNKRINGIMKYISNAFIPLSQVVKYTGKGYLLEFFRNSTKNMPHNLQKPHPD